MDIYILKIVGGGEKKDRGIKEEKIQLVGDCCRVP